jgi:hypothetical protein
VRGRVELDERLQDAGQGRRVHQRVAEEDQDEHRGHRRALQRGGTADEQPAVVKTHESAKAKTMTRTRPRARRASALGLVAEHEAHEDHDRAGQDVAQRVGQHGPDERRRLPDGQRPEPVDDAVVRSALRASPDVREVKRTAWTRIAGSRNCRYAPDDPLIAPPKRYVNRTRSTTGPIVTSMSCSGTRRTFSSPRQPKAAQVDSTPGAAGRGPVARTSRIASEPAGDALMRPGLLRRRPVARGHRDRP